MDIFQISISCAIFEILLHIKIPSLFIWNTNVTGNPVFLLNQATLPPAHDHSYSSILFIVLCLSTVDTRGKPYVLHFSFSYTQQLPLNFILLLLLFSPSVLSDSLWSLGLQHARLPYPSLSLAVCSNSCPLSQWCHTTISLSVAPFSSCSQSFPASDSSPMSWLFASGVQSTRASASASVLPINIQGWFYLGLTGLISLLFKELSSVFSNITVPKHKFFSTLPSLWSNSHICPWLQGKP